MSSRTVKLASVAALVVMVPLVARCAMKRHEARTAANETQEDPRDDSYARRTTPDVADVGSKSKDKNKKDDSPRKKAKSKKVQAKSAGKKNQKAKLMKDVSFGPAPAHKLDVYAPANPNKAPILFVVHGGAWRLGDKAADAVVRNKVRYWRGKGYIVTSTNYRLRGADPVEQAQDVAKALSFVQRKASEWGGDANKLVVLGHSAGAHLVSLLAADFELARGQGCKPWLGTVALDSAAFDVEAIMRRRHMGFYDKVFGSDEKFWRAASPLHRMSELRAPFLAVCSSERNDSCPQAEAFVERAQKMGGTAQVVRVAKSHKELNEDLGDDESYTSKVSQFIQQLGLP